MTNILFFLSYAIMWKNIIGWSRSQVTIWHTRIACWIPKATNTHIHCFSTATVVALTRLNETYDHCLSCYILGNHTPSIIEVSGKDISRSC